MMRIYLGHGAAGSAASMAPWVDGLRERGFEAHALTLPRRKAELALGAFEEQVPDSPDVVVGGHSFGGRVASLVAAGVGHGEAAGVGHGEAAGVGHGEFGNGEDAWLAGPARRCAALVCLSYPLHRPGAPETTAARTAHWPQISCPTLLLSGTRDPFASLDLLEAAVPAMPDGRLVTYEKMGHGLLPVRADALDRIAAFLIEVERARAGR